MMKNKVYQRIDDPRKGDCWKCTICTLLGLDYDEVPNFVEYGDKWFEMGMEVFKQQGYKLTGRLLYNPKLVFLEDPTWNVWENNYPVDEKTFGAIKPEYAKVVNYPYSKLIGYNGIRCIDIITKI